MTRSNLLLLALILCIALLPLFGGSYALRLGTIACMYGILALSWNVVGGFAGYPSFATAAFFGFGAYSAGVLMVAEVTPGDADGDHRIRADKRAAYAAAGVPVYLVVDRGERSLTVHSEPEEDTYRSSVTRPLGAVIHLPSPVAVSLRTTELELFAH